MTNTLCELATKLPNLVANLLDREDKLRRGRFREETLTDIFTGSLAAFAGPELIIEYPPEAATGGDIDLQFWNITSRHFFCVRIQAKRLNGNVVKAKYRSYNELLHRVPKKTGPYQYDTLAKKSRPYLPLYMFYNHGSVVQNPEFSGGFPDVSGINLAFASDIAKEMDIKLSALPKRLHYKRLSHLRGWFFGLDTILCPGGPHIGGVPTPDRVVAALRDAKETVRSFTFDRSEAEYLRLVRDDESLGEHYGVGQRFLEGPPIRINESLERTSVTFISGKSKDF